MLNPEEDSLYQLYLDQLRRVDVWQAKVIAAERELATAIRERDQILRELFPLGSNYIVELHAYRTGEYEDIHGNLRTFILSKSESTWVTGQVVAMIQDQGLLEVKFTDAENNEIIVRVMP